MSPKSKSKSKPKRSKKSSPLKGVPWTAAAKAKAVATREANAAKKAGLKPNAEDALAYLLKAERILLNGNLKRFGPFETLIMLALNALRGEM